MSLKVRSSFSTGELDPAIQERTVLDKSQKGLDRAKNVIVSRTGSVISRMSRANFVQTKLNDRAVVCYSPPNSGILLEWGHLYVRVYNFSATLIIDLAHTFTEDDIEDLHFESSGPYVYIFLKGSQVKKMLFDSATPSFVSSGDVFAIPTAPTNGTVTPTGTPGGGFVDYLVTKVFNGEESEGLIIAGASTNKLPIATGQFNDIEAKVLVGTADEPILNEMRVYRRPQSGGAFGFIGATTFFKTVGSDIHAVFTDLGGDEDFSNSQPSIITEEGLEAVDIIDLDSKTGTVYQQRLLVTDDVDEEAIIASRPGFQNNFFRDFPLGLGSALKFKSGTSGNAKVLRMIESDGLIVFTTIGVFSSVGALSATNLSLEKKGAWIIDDKVPPLAVPGGVLFVDKSTNAVRELQFEEDSRKFIARDQTIFSHHIFLTRTVKYWGFHFGKIPILWTVFNDGTAACFTYDPEHEMRAWTRIESQLPIESVAPTGFVDSTFFVVKQVTSSTVKRFIEVTLPRYIPPDVVESNTEADKTSPNFCMDALETTQNLLNDSLGGGDQFVLVPQTGDGYSGTMSLASGATSLFPQPGLGDIGTKFKFFHPIDGSTVVLTVVSFVANNIVIVKPDVEFPEEYDEGFRLYQTFTTITGLDHFQDGEAPLIISDGEVICSPYNDKENLPAATVTSGSLTLPNDKFGAIILVGRPVVCELKTLQVDTVEQSPTLIESLTVNKAYVALNNSRGLYMANDFPASDTGVRGMQDLEEFELEHEVDGFFTANRYFAGRTKRQEITLPGNWKNQGQVAIRQVDGLHFEILSLILDVEIEGRGR